MINFILALILIFAPLQNARIPGPGGKGAGGGGASAVLLQHPSAHCTGSHTTCSITLTQTITAGSFLVFLGAVDTTGTTASSINVGGTLVACSGSANTACNKDGTSFTSLGGWVLSSTSTAGPIVFTYSNSVNSSEIEMREYSCSGGSASHDVDGTRDSGSDTSPYTGVALTLTGTNDVVVTMSDGKTVDPTSITTYSDFEATSGGPGVANLMNSTSGTAPSWTAAGNTSGSTTTAIAMKCQ